MVVLGIVVVILALDIVDGILNFSAQGEYTKECVCKGSAVQRNMRMFWGLRQCSISIVDKRKHQHNMNEG